MLQFYSKDWNHRAYWGKDRIEHGKGGQATGYQHLGDLPPAGQWYRLEVKPGDVGLEPGVRITGWAFTQYVARCSGSGGHPYFMASGG